MRVGALLAVFAVSCGGAASGPRPVAVYGQDPATRGYGRFIAQLNTLEDLGSVRGGAASFLVGADFDVVANPADLSDLSDVRISGGSAPLARFHEQEDGVSVALDYDSLGMVSAYWALETARASFIALGLDAAALPALRTYYQPHVHYLTDIVPTFFAFTDDAAYDPVTDAFVLAPPLTSPGIPLFMNLGVIGHEYGHKVFNHLVEHDLRGGLTTRPAWSVESQRQLDGLNEGLSDLFGATLSTDPRFIGISLPASNDARDLTVVRQMNAADANVALGRIVSPPFEPHALGAFVASFLWAAGEQVSDRARVARAVLDAERALGARFGPEPDADFGLALFFDAWLADFTPSEQALLCPLLHARLGRVLSADASHPLRSCP